jgi:phage shock protein C
MICTNCGKDITENSNFCYYCGARQLPRPSPLSGKRLMRSAVDRKLAGVCGGMAEYFEIDPTLVRLLWILITVLTGIIPCVLLYLAAWFIMPVAPPPMVSVPAADRPSPQGA